VGWLRFDLIDPPLPSGGFVVETQISVFDSPPDHTHNRVQASISFLKNITSVEYLPVSIFLFWAQELKRKKVAKKQFKGLCMLNNYSCNISKKKPQLKLHTHTWYCVLGIWFKIIDATYYIS
jgi:hypothetical protein